jgi:type II secretory pathway predicted ATPase ExeA
MNIRVLLGEPGTGKTAILMSLLERWRSSAFAIRLFWTQLLDDEFLQYLLRELGGTGIYAGVGEARLELARILEQNFSRGREVIVAIDEAHNLSISTLRQVAELLDSDIARSKNLQIILAGLPSLETKLRSPDLRELSDRISGIVTLTPLTADESASYIKRKLELSELRSDDYLSDDAIGLIANLAGGIPRQIDNFCFEVAYRAEQRGCGKIDAGVVLEALPQCADTPARTDREEVSHREVPSELHHSNAQILQFNSPSAWAGNDEEFSFCLSEWFGYERLAWCGTAGELAASLQQPEGALLPMLSSSSESLRKLGIQLSMAQSYGETTSVRLRSLETRKKMSSETIIGTEASIPEQSTVDASTNTEAEVPPEPAVTQAPQESPVDNQAPAATSSFESENVGLNRGSQNNSAERTPFDQTLSALVAAAFEDTRQPSQSRLRRAVVPALLSIVALGLAIAITHTSLFRDESSNRYSPTASTATEEPTVEGDEQRRNPSSLQKKTTPTVPSAVNPGSKLLQAARSGNSKAQFDIGSAYVAGRGVPVDPVAGYTWLTVAFANGNMQAQNPIRQLTPTLNPDQIAQVRRNLGEMYADGVGVRPDKVAAYMWYFLADLSGNGQSRIEMARLARTMTPAEQSEAQSRAYQWLRKHQQPANVNTPTS